jgi:hypothetical protein
MGKGVKGASIKQVENIGGGSWTRREPHIPHGALDRATKPLHFLFLKDYTPKKFLGRSKMARFLLALFLALAMGACEGTHRVTPNVGLTERKTIEAGAPVFIAVPADGKYGDARQPGSGAAVAHALKAAVSRKVSSVTIGGLGLSCQDLLGPAKKAGSRYMFCPSIKEWQDRDPTWSGLPDTIVIEMLVYEVASGKLLSSMTISAMSKWIALTNDPPETLLAEPFEKYVNELF